MKDNIKTLQNSTIITMPINFLLVFYAVSRNLISNNQDQNSFEKLIFYHLLRVIKI